MSDHEQRAGDAFTATWTPKRTDDLKPGVQDWIARNQPSRWERLWVITPEDGGPYVGQWACGVHESEIPEGDHPPFVWVPESDLTASSGAAEENT
jgi:hypothetical protein